MNEQEIRTEELRTNEISANEISANEISANEIGTAEIRISEHAYCRLKERNGWNRKTADRMAMKIYRNGVRAENKKGYIGVLTRQRNTIRQRRGMQNREYIIYGKQVYVFSEHVMVTVLTEPKRSSLDPYREKFLWEYPEAIAI